MRLRRNYNNNTSFLDLLFNTLVGFVLLFIVSFLLIAPTSKMDLKTKAEFVITVTWDDASKDDVDTWLEDPIGNVLYFNNKETGLMHLDRDDLGSKNDTIILPNGEILELKVNQEIVTIRGYIPGEWTLNIHMYNKRNAAGKAEIAGTPVTVLVKVDKLNPKVTPIVHKTIILIKKWEQVTVARFVMAADGTITDLNYLPKDLIRSKIMDGPGGV
jgi:hypothetical protein